MKDFKAALTGSLLLMSFGGLLWQQQEIRRLKSESILPAERDLVVAGLPAEKVGAAAEAAERVKLQQEVEVPWTKVGEFQRQQEAWVKQAKPEVGRPDERTLATDLKPASSLTNAGRATPRAAAETGIWAVNGGDTELLADSIVLLPESRALAVQAFDKLSPEKRAAFGSVERMVAELMGETTEVAGFQVMSERSGARVAGLDPALANDPSYRTLHTQVQYVDGRVREGDSVFQQTPDGWRGVVQVGSLMKRLVETGLMAPPGSKAPPRG